MENRELMEEELDLVTGGITAPELIEKMKRTFTFLPAEVLAKVADATKKFGIKGGRGVAEELARKDPKYQCLRDLFPG